MTRRVRATLPRSRSASGFIVEPVGNELLVYDNRRNRAHRLNRAAAAIWRLCDGKTTISAASKALRAEGLPAERAVIELAIGELTRAGLVEPAVDWSKVRFRSRRRLLKQLGLMSAVAVALPIVQSIVAPSLALAASCGNFFALCGPGHPACCPRWTCQRLFPGAPNLRCL